MPHSPTVRRLRLASELRRLREGAGLSGAKAAERLQWSTSKISRLEKAQVTPHEKDVRALLVLYRVPEDQQVHLLALSRDAAKKGWWEEHFEGLPEQVTTHLGLEAEAASVWTWQPIVVPGLLQTADYSRAVSQGLRAITVAPPGEIEERTKARLVRQEALTREDPLRFWAVIEESVLIRRFTDDAVMRDQLRQIVEMAALPNVTVQVLPLNGPHPIGTGSFTLFKFSRLGELGRIYPDVAYLENLSGSYYHEEEADTYRYELSFERLAESALDPEESVRLIERVAAHTWS
ncbi:helix-turn-helix domain-containing protein [Spirillospora sp. NPDC048911]|uniref:helix-turn-helix domain-containing protein n=1 Tax=Spirillospora sp. NPDC048911 TaxID=3364527 RepID=UPI003718AD53